MQRINRWPVAAAALAALYPLAEFAIAPPLRPSAAAAAVALVCGVLLLLAALARWVPAPRALAAVAAAWLVVALAASSPAAALGFALGGGAALAIGARLSRGLDRVSIAERVGIAYLAGLAVLVTGASAFLLTPWPIHSPASYAAACALICVVLRRDLAMLLQAASAAASQRLRMRCGVAEGAALLAVAIVWMLGAMGSLTPVAAFDDLSFHLRLPTELVTHHRYSFDVAHQLFAAAPWAADLAYAIPYVISGGDEGVKAWVAGSYHLASAVLLFGLLRRRLAPLPSLLFLAAYLSTPLLLAATHALHTEGISSAIAVAVMLLWVSGRDASDARLRGHEGGPANSGERAPLGNAALLAALLLGFLGSIKATNLPVCLAAGLLWLPAFRDQLAAGARRGLAVFAALAIVVIPYATAWVKTGNPVLPLFNAFFASPYFPRENFSNPVYTGMFDARLFAGLFLHGGRHFETTLATVAGLGLFVLLPSALVILAARGDVERRAALGVALFASLLLLGSQQYVRYLLPVMGIAFFAATAVWEAVDAARPALQGVWKSAWAVLLVAAVAVDAAGMQKATWQTSFPQIARSLTASGRAAYIDRFAADRKLMQAANRDFGPYARVLMLADPTGAELQGVPIYTNWYAHTVLKDVDQWRDESAVEAFLRKHRVTHVVMYPVDRPVPDWARNPITRIHDYASAHGRVVETTGTTALVRLDPAVGFPLTTLDALAAPGRNEVSPGHSFIAAGGTGLERQLLLDLRGRCDAAQARLAINVGWDRHGETTWRDAYMVPCGGPDGRTLAFQQAFDAPRRNAQLRVRFEGWGGGIHLDTALVRGR